MFEVGIEAPRPGWDDVPDHVLATCAPPPDEPQVPDALWDSWIDRLVAADPERPRTAAEILHEAEHGPLTAALIGELTLLDPAALPPDHQVALTVAADRAVSVLTARKLAAVSAFAGPVPAHDVAPEADDFHFAWCDIGAALRVGEGTARNLCGVAAGFRRLPATFAALGRGDISYAKALRILEATATLTDEQARDVENRVLPGAGARTHAAHSGAVGRAVRAADPAGWKRRREQRLADVALVRMSEGDGVASVLARNIDALDAELLWTAADTYARHHKATGDARTLDALRVAFLVDAAKTYLATGTLAPSGDDAPGDDVRGDETCSEDLRGDDVHGDDAHGDDVHHAGRAECAGTAERPRRRPYAAPTRHGLPAVVNVIIALPALVGASDAPGMLAGSGDVLPADAVAELLHAGARIRFALTDATGNLVGISTTAHDAPALMRAFITLRDITLRVPTGSTTAIAGHDGDHIDPHGGTEPANLHHVSRGWHRAKTFRHWTIRANPDRTITWTSRRTGRSYTTAPHDYRDGP